MMRRHAIPMVFLGLLALALGCDPEPELVGSDVASSDEWEVEWRASGSLGAFILDVAAMSDGGAVVVESDPVGRPFLRRYSVGGAELFAVQLPGQPYDLVVSGDMVLVSGSAPSNEVISRAAVWRYSSNGALEASYVHPRPGDSNSFGFEVAIGSTAVALVVGNWGTLAPGESWFEVLRLSHDLQPLGESLPFSGNVEAVGFGGSGELLVLETDDSGPDAVHTLGTDAPPLDVDCAILHTDRPTPVCTTILSPLQVTDLETGSVLDLGELGFGGQSAVSIGGPSLVFHGAIDDALLSRVVEVLDDGTVAREVEIPATADTEHISMLPGGSRASDGAVFVTTLEHKAEALCSGLGITCSQSHLIRLAPP